MVQTKVEPTKKTTRLMMDIHLMIISLFPFVQISSQNKKNKTVNNNKELPKINRENSNHIENTSMYSNLQTNIPVALLECL